MVKTCKIIFLFIVGLHVNVNAQLHVPGMENFRQVMSNCTIDYTMKCIYPGGQVYDIVGKMAVKENNFYDSSNIRYVFLNKDWYIIADHIEKIVSVAYIRDINKELDDIATVTASTYLFNDDLFTNILKVNIVKQNDDTSWLSLKFKDSSIIERLEVQTLRKNLQPVRYSAIINYPIGGYEDGDAVTVRLSMDCFNIVTPVPDGFFDDKRLISLNGKKASLKKFNTYKTYK